VNSHIHSIAAAYFDYLGAQLPHQCASDEFYFLPRSEKAVDYLGTLDDMRPDKIEEVLAQIQSLRTALSRETSDDPQEEIDRITVQQSMDRFIWEFGVFGSWRRDPTLYIKIPLFACDEIMSRVPASSEHLRDSFSSLFSQIPGFLEQALKNLHRPAGNSLRVAMDMAVDALSFFQHDVTRFIEETLGGDPGLLELNHVVLHSWESYRKGLESFSPDTPFAMGEVLFSELLKTCLCYPRSAGEVLELAQEAFDRTLERAKYMAKQICQDKTWQSLVHDENGQDAGFPVILQMYRNEVRKLRGFFRSHDVMTFPAGESVEVLPTPSYLVSLRATASYKAPLTGKTAGKGVFFITPFRGISRLVRSHVAYLSAHETYPGHHVLDTFRIQHPNLIGRQIESPLFYEGWSCYGETLLDDLGYVTEPKRQLVQVQRQLWRDLRAILDVKLHTKRATMDGASKEIQELGFSSEGAHRQLRRFALTPGYQSCYFLGMYEIQRLREQFEPRLGLRRFHDVLLLGGQIGFDLVKQRLESAVETGDSRRPPDA
jgi:hypothetical protein